MKRLGIAALGCYAVHAAYHLAHGQAENLLWACHFGAVLVGIGLVVSSATLNGVGALLLCMGTPLWLRDLVAGAKFMPTSCFTHIGALLIGLYGAWRLGMPQGLWWKSSAALMTLIVIARLVTPAEANVNVAFSIHPGWEPLFPSHKSYLTIMVLLASVYFFITQQVLIFCNKRLNRYKREETMS